MYVDATGYAMPCLSGQPESPDSLFAAVPAGVVKQHASDGHYEPTIRSGINAGFDTVSVADGARIVARQINPAWVDVGSAGLYPVAGSSEQASGIAEMM